MLPRPNCCLLIATMRAPECASFSLPGLVFTTKLDWKPYVQSVAKQASQRVGSLFRSQRYLTPETIMYLNKATILPMYGVLLPYLEWCPQPGGLNLLDRVQRRLVNLIGPVLLSTLQPLFHRRVVASLSFFTSIIMGDVPRNCHL